MSNIYISFGVHTHALGGGLLDFSFVVANKGEVVQNDPDVLIVWA
jgi:hypothetical protein